MTIQIKKTAGEDRLVICDGEEVGTISKTRHDVTFTCTCDAQRTTKFMSDLRLKIQTHLSMSHGRAV